MVLLTLYYMVATTAQSWRLRSIYQKITRVLDNKQSIVFLKTSEQSSEGISSAFAVSDLGTNSSSASVVDCIWSNENSQSISVMPKQVIFLNPFVTFPSPPSLLPFKVASSDMADLDGSGIIYTLIEADLLPMSTLPSLEIEKFGNLMAWKVDTKLSVILATNSNLFSQMVFVTFMQDNFAINDGLKMLRIQTVDIEGKAQNYEDIASHSKVSERLSDNLSPEEWEKHFDGIKNFSVFASQASEFEFKKNLTEGKTGVVQPDLISSNVVDVKPQTPQKTLKNNKMLDLEKTSDKIEGLRVDYHQQEILKSPMNTIVGFPAISKNSPNTPDSPKFPIESPTPSTISKASSGPLSPKFPSSPAKKKLSLGKDTKIPKVEVKTVSSEKLISAEKVVMLEEVVEKKKSPVEKPKPLEIPKVGEKPLIIQPIKPPPQPEDPAKLLKTQSIRRKKQKQAQAKPPNILVYSDSIVTRDNVIKTLGEILKKNTYTIYPLTSQQAENRIWMDNACLLIVCGSVNGVEVGNNFLDFFFRGGKVLCLCSDLLGLVLPTYHTAEVREHELVQFSYGKWKNIKMMHHIFCYQPSPIRKHFSQESDDPPKQPSPRSENPLQVLLRSVELKDRFGISHNIRVQTLGTEDTWKTPSLLMVYIDNGGKMIFSQIHLEVDPSLYENDEQKYQTLLSNDGLRHEIFSDVLNSHLGMAVKESKAEGTIKYSRGFFLGRHELKFEVLEELKSKMETPNMLKLDSLTVKFCGKGEDPPHADVNCFPVMIHSCPDDFSTLDYFDALKTEKIGRLVIYTNVLGSSSILVNKTKYMHGFAVVPRILTAATGRGSNQWLSPEGCLMFSLQLHVPLSSPLGGRLPLIQHLVATAVVNSITSIPGCQALEVNLKWPNDIYVDGSIKVGGLIVNTLVEGNTAICNIGLGLNLSNSTPTTCINDFIATYNKQSSKNIQPLSFEKCLAMIFNEIESIFNKVQTGDMNYLFELYYKHWLHSGSSVTVVSKSGDEKSAQIVGIDEYGFLQVKPIDSNESYSVQPDGNSFDMIRGLIIPKA